MKARKAEFEAIQFELEGGLSCFGELVAANSQCRTISILLHDEGEDLDRMRWLAARLCADGISSLLLDLPGHGLSDGRFPGDLPMLFSAVGTFARSRGFVLTTFVAKGTLGHAVLVHGPIGSPVALVLLAPVEEEATVEILHPSWERVPKLALIPAENPASARFAEVATHDTYAWCLRSTLSFDPGSLSDVAETQIGSIVGKFLLEQISFAEVTLPERVFRHSRSVSAPGEDLRV